MLTVRWEDVNLPNRLLLVRRGLSAGEETSPKGRRHRFVLIARTADPVFVRDFLGHAKLTTTDRYLSSKLRPEELRRLDDAFAPASTDAADASVDRSAG